MAIFADIPSAEKTYCQALSSYQDAWTLYRMPGQTEHMQNLMRVCIDMRQAEMVEAGEYIREQKEGS